MFGKRSLLLAAGAVLAVTMAGNALADGRTSLEEAKALAAKENKLVLIDFYAVWCSPCKAFDRHMKTDSDIQAAVAEFVFLRTDAEREGRALAKEFSVAGFPTYVVMSADGTTLDRWYGYGKEMFLGKTGKALADPSTIEQKRARFETSPTAEDAIRLATFHDSSSEYSDAIAYYEAAAKLGGVSDYSFDTFSSTFYGYRDEVFTLDDLVARGNTLFASNHVTEPELIHATELMTSAGHRADNTAAAAPFLKQAMDRTEASLDPGVRAARTRLLPDYAMIVLGDPEKAVTYKKASMKEGWMENPSQLNGFAWWCFENELNLEEAYALSKKGAELAESGPDRAMILDTVAEICNAMDDCNQALKIIRQAIKEDPNRDYFKKQEQRFLELLAQKNKL